MGGRTEGKGRGGGEGSGGDLLLRRIWPPAARDGLQRSPDILAGFKVSNFNKKIKKLKRKNVTKIKTRL